MPVLKQMMLCTLLLAAGPVAAHSGGLNSEGCHTNRSTGEYHCHRGPARTAAPAPPAAQRFAPANSAPAGAAAGTRPFVNCDAARAAGAAPVRRGDPGYGTHLDRDSDGVGCEPYRGR
ncbi:excalibur calcium-binding domain-containing protein [Luteimonas sp. MC1572]|nr:excalibur calcium-binding domain-containing protein [Luteimonas sp. MC1572]QQO04226.1 excalibur calcium-binding domain-containing protein [Luteimonas sp. MC1572]